MADYTIPQQLIDLFKEGRVIPFIGAGFSSVFGLPSWQTLLEDLGHNLGDGLTFQEVSEFAQGDYLQIAEYYYLKTGGHIGPLRHTISQKLPTAGIDPLQSGHHVDLINLGMSKIYTTNYDDLLEKTYESLGILKDVIILAKHVATSLGTLPQIVKYHGDLQYEDTLVLTESKYYSRLDFESPMDLKFRADLLGRAVLFLGYSFRDLNIRVIWFKLREMMQDVSPEDRPTSYMVTFEPNPVLETLYQAVGISTIVLDPNGTIQTNDDRSHLLSDFMLDLSQRVCEGTIPNRPEKPFVSESLIRQAEQVFERLKEAPTRPRRLRSGTGIRPYRPDATIDSELEYSLALAFEALSVRTVLGPFAKRTSNLLMRAVREQSGAFRYPRSAIQLLEVAISVHKIDPALHGPAIVIVRGLCRGQGRTFLQQQDIDWKQIWSLHFDDDLLQYFVRSAEEELEGHKSHGIEDSDLFYCGDVLKKMANGQLIGNDSDELRASAEETLESIYDYYDRFKGYESKEDQMPDLDELAEMAIEDVRDNDEEEEEFIIEER